MKVRIPSVPELIINFTILAVAITVGMVLGASFWAAVCVVIISSFNIRLDGAVHAEVKRTK